MIGDPYEKANEEGEAKLLTPTPAKKSRKLLKAAGVAIALVVLVVALTHVVSSVSLRVKPQSRGARPTTMSKGDADAFSRQQRDEGDYFRNHDNGRKAAAAEDSLLGDAGATADDPYAEDPSAPRRTQAQDDTEHGRTKPKSNAELRYEKRMAEQDHRRQQDLDSSPVAVDFSDYFEKQSRPTKPAGGEDKKAPLDTAESDPPRRRSAFDDVLNGGDEEQSYSAAKQSNREPHDPVEDYSYDSAHGKLYRLPEDSVIETVLVNRLTGATRGQVTVMATTNVYSGSQQHLLIPKGTRILGEVSAVASVNQQRLFVAFHRMILPNGYSVSLDKFRGLDVVGQAGLRDLVNHHYAQIFGTSIALAAVATTANIGNTSAYGTYDWGTQMRTSAAGEIGQNAQRVMERFLNVLPTFTIRERSRVKILTSQDLLLHDVNDLTMNPDL